MENLEYLIVSGLLRVNAPLLLNSAHDLLDLY